MSRLRQRPAPPTDAAVTECSGDAASQVLDQARYVTVYSGHGVD